MKLIEKADFSDGKQDSSFLERWLNFVISLQNIGFGYLSIVPSVFGASHSLVNELKNSSDYPGACPYPRRFCKGRLPPPLRTNFQGTDLSVIMPY